MALNQEGLLLGAGAQALGACSPSLSLQTDIVKAIARLIEFYKHESCGQCTPCREGKCPRWGGGFLYGPPWAGRMTDRLCTLSK